MVPRELLVTLLFLLCVLCVSTGSALMLETCHSYSRMNGCSVPGDMAMFNSTLLSPNVFNYNALPYNVSWYDLLTGTELANQTGRFLLRRETLWLLNVTLKDAGEYVCVVRTASGCFSQTMNLVVDPAPDAGICGRPQRTSQSLTRGTNEYLSCALTHYISKLKSYGVPFSISWYKGCDLIDGSGRFNYEEVAMLAVKRVSADDAGSYTCTLTFDLAGVSSSVSETINAEVHGDYVMRPEIRVPAFQVIKVEIGSSFSRTCKMFVPCVGPHQVRVMWLSNGRLISEESSDSRRYAEAQLSQRVEEPRPGNMEERLLRFREVREEDLHTNYTCRAYSDLGLPEVSFNLQPADPNHLNLIAMSLFGGAGLFVAITVFYFLFKMDIALWFRRAFPFFYRNTESDGKLFDAYVMFPRHAGKAVESFALQALPFVLERQCGYKLFIPGRDCLPGQAVVDSVEENMRASRRLILIYTASAFTGHQDEKVSSTYSSTSSREDGTSPGHTLPGDGIPGHTLPGDGIPGHTLPGDGIPGHTLPGDGIPGHTLPGHPQPRQQSEGRQSFECQLAMHRALLEESLKVVLVEMEEVRPDQLALFPASVLHLRKKQGALCWWRSQRRSRAGWRRWWGRDAEEEENVGLDLGCGEECLSLSSSFWKQMWYHMPIRGKRTSYPENMSLLNL